MDFSLCWLYLLILFIPGCSPAPEALSNREEAHQKFLAICKEEYKLPLSIKPVGSTLWIYLPVEDNIIEYKAMPRETRPWAGAKEQRLLNHVDGRFEAQTFYVEYAITPNRVYPNPAAMKSFYSDAIQEKQNHILTALFRSYADLEKSGSQTTSPQAPAFVVFVIADTKRGIENVSVFYFEDFRYVMAGLIPQEEFALRNAVELRGDRNALGDTEGRHLDYKEITWPEFLIKVILHRIRFKYQASHFQPSGDDETEIITITAQTLKSYSFSDFTSVKLRNLGTGKEFLFEKKLLETFAK